MHIDSGSTSSSDGADTTTHHRLVPEASRVTFTTRHLANIAPVSGSVDLVGGRIATDTRTGDLVSVEAELDMRSFASASRKRDEVVASAVFLDSAAHPTAVYRATRAERTADGWLVHGTLTVKGDAVPVDLRVAHRDPDASGMLRATASLDRFAFGIRIPTLLAARRLAVELDLRVEPVRVPVADGSPA